MSSTEPNPKVPILKSGDQGPAVRQWQKFLLAQDMISRDPLISGDGVFGVGTAAGTRAYQKSRQLSITGVVDAETYTQAVKDGFAPTTDI